MSSLDAPRILCVIPTLERGGAERQAILLAREAHGQGVALDIVAWRGGGAFEYDVRDLEGTRVLGPADLPLPRRLARLRRVVRSYQPDAIYGFMTSGQLIATLGRRWHPDAALVWGLRASQLDWSKYSRRSRAFFELAARLSPGVELAIANSVAGATSHQQSGYRPKHMAVVHNGIDVGRFTPSPVHRAATRAALGIAADEPVIGLVARLDPMKDHPGFLEAAAMVHAARPEVRFVCAGSGRADYAAALRHQATTLGLDSVLQWIPDSGSIETIYPALDLGVSTSITEGFPNVVGEAMASGVPCVVTDVGECALVVGDTGLVVAPRHPAAAAEAWLRALDSDRVDRGRAARARVTQRFGPARLLRDTLREITAAVDLRRRHRQRR